MQRSLLISTCLFSTLVFSAQAATDSQYTQTNFVANKAKYKPTFATEKDFINAWGISNRPAGAGGHFWVTAKDISYEYVGDVHASSDEKLRALHTDELKIVKLPVGGAENFSTGTVFVDSKDQFVITQDVQGAGPITAPSKFLFSSDGGIISAWTERKKADGSFDRAKEALNVIDKSKDGAQYFGLAINKAYNRIYAANFGVNPDIQVFDGKFQPENIIFDQPFDDNKNGKVDPGEYAPFNVQQLNGSIFVSYAKTQPCPAEEIKAGSCKKDGLFVGEEDTSKPGYGRLAEFDDNGKLIAVWNDGGKLSAPWGMVFAPQDFGTMSGRLLVGNFGDGTIASFDAKTREFTGYMMNEKGKPVVIDKLWGLLFGNGASLGDSNALYFAAGPDDEKDGVFGSLRLAKQP